MMKDDYEHSRDRWYEQEELRAKQTGWGTTRQGHAIRRRYRKRFQQRLDADRGRPHHKEIWRALKDAGRIGTGLATGQFLDRLLVMGITAAAGDGIGVDKDGVRNLRDQALWLGQHLGIKCSQVDLQFKVGAWAIEILNDRPFALDEDGLLTLPLTPSLERWLNAVVEHGFQSAAFLFPSAEPPEPWTQVRKGGLPPGNDWAKPSLISSYHRKSEDAVRNAIARGQMQPVLDAINSLAGTAFIINKPVLAFMRRREEPRIKKLSAEAEALAREHELRKLSWSERQKLANLTSELTVWELDMAAAEILASRDRFFVPLQIDFRGRINPLPFFNFTRQDHIRGLFLFDARDPVGEEGLRYLKAHVARSADGNEWSTVERPSNLDLAGRIAWTDDNLERLLKVGNAVLRGEDPAQIEWVLQQDMADTLVLFHKPDAEFAALISKPKPEGISDPYQFVAACCELAQALEVGASFPTRLPLMFDATCSGLQHICAMMRAEEGKYINLVPSNELNDFYSIVGAAVYRKTYDKIPEHLRAIDETCSAYKFPKQIPDEELGLLRFFKDGNPFDRKIVKRPGMTYGYGSRPGGWVKPERGRGYYEGMAKQIADVLKERGQSTWEAHKLAKALYDVIEEMMPAAKALRNFLEKTAKVCTKYNKPVRWKTLLGLPVVNAYYDEIIDTISVTISGKRYQRNLITGHTDDIDSTANTSITANFVHSSDACHLHMVVNATAKEAIPLVTIHDCFGCLAPHAKRVNEILREQFVQLHEGYNWLEQVLDSVKNDLPADAKLPKLPARGNLNLAGVLQSFFAFK